MIQSEINNLRHQAAIYQDVINGAVISHPSLQSDGCSISGAQRKVKAKNTKPASKGIKKSANSKASQTAKLEIHPLEHAEYTVYTPPPSVRITHEITPVHLETAPPPTKNSDIKASAFAPVSKETVTTGAHCPYHPDPKIRVVGSGFFPDQEAVTAPPVQDQIP